MRWHIRLQRNKRGRHITHDAAINAEGRTMVWQLKVACELGISWDFVSRVLDIMSLCVLRPYSSRLRLGTVRFQAWMVT